MANIYVISEKTKKVIRELKSLAMSKLSNGKVLPRIPEVMFASLDNDNRLGYYEVSQDLIVMSKDFLDDTIKDIRNNIFLHELAHFLDYHRHGSSAHDKTFKEICKELGVDPDYSGAVAKDYFAKKEQMKSKVDKLMALSKSDYEAEADSAISKAKQLMEQYNLKYISEAPTDEIYGIDIVTGARIDVWKRLLQSVISDITGVFRLEHNSSSGKSLSFFGSLEQCESALYLWEHFEYHVNEQYKEIAKNVSGRAKPAEIRNDIVQGLHQKVRNGNCKALTISQEKNENLYCAITGARISHTKLNMNAGSQYNAGHSAGSSMEVPTGKGGFTKRIGYNG